MQGFKIGTVVQLKSGSPRMTISSEPAQWGYGEGGPLEQMCQWFVGHESRQDHFPIDGLQEVSGGGGAVAGGSPPREIDPLL